MPAVACFTIFFVSLNFFIIWFTSVTGNPGALSDTGAAAAVQKLRLGPLGLGHAS